jgi:hypothetical protein
LVSQIHGGASYGSPDNPWTGSAVMTERWRLVHGLELFDVIQDPGQRQDVAARHPGVFQRLRKFHEQWYAEMQPTMVPTAITIGSDEENPTDLTSEDWIMPTGSTVWSHGHVLKRPMLNGPWAIQIDRDGTYRFTLSRWPRYINDLDLGKRFAIESVAARIAVGGMEKRVEIAEPDVVNEVRLEVPLTAGACLLQTWLTTADGREHGAYFVTVERLE